MAAGVITTGNHPKALWPGIRAWWGRSYKEHEMEWKEFLDTASSDKGYEEYAGFQGLGYAAIKPEGSPVAYATMQQGYIPRLTNVAIGVPLRLTVNP